MRSISSSVTFRADNPSERTPPTIRTVTFEPRCRESSEATAREKCTLPSPSTSASNSTLCFAFSISHSMNRVEKTCSRQHPGIDAEIFRDGFSCIGKRFPHTEVYSLLSIDGICEKRNILPRMVGTVVGRIVAVVGSNHQNIFFVNRPENPWQMLVEKFDCAGHSLCILPVSVDHIEVHKVRHDKALFHRG